MIILQRDRHALPTPRRLARVILLGAAQTDTGSVAENVLNAA
jgi:hypothetical protein